MHTHLLKASTDPPPTCPAPSFPHSAVAKAGAAQPHSWGAGPHAFSAWGPQVSQASGCGLNLRTQPSAPQDPVRGDVLETRQSCRKHFLNNRRTHELINLGKYAETAAFSHLEKIHLVRVPHPHPVTQQRRPLPQPQEQRGRTGPPSATAPACKAHWLLWEIDPAYSTSLLSQTQVFQEILSEEPTFKKKGL